MKPTNPKRARSVKTMEEESLENIEHEESKKFLLPYWQVYGLITNRDQSRTCIIFSFAI